MAPKSKKSSGLSPATFSGMSPKRFKSKGGGGGYKKRLPLKKGVTIPVMFLQEPDDFREFEVHAFQEGGYWKFVPHAEEACPLCEADSEQIRRRSYRFCANVYNMEAKAVQIMEGGSNLATVVHSRYTRKPTSFLRKVFDVTMFPTQPVSFGCELAEEEPLSSKKIDRLELHDLDEYIVGAMKDYYGDDLSKVDLDLSSLDDDDDDDDEDEAPVVRKKKKSTKSKSK